MSRILDSAYASITKYFVAKHLGLHHIEKQQVVENHTLPPVKILLADTNSNKATAILDVTYCYI